MRNVIISCFSLFLLFFTLSFIKYRVTNNQEIFLTDELESLASFDKPHFLCHPAEHTMFVKTHKCASTTIQNILLRYGYRNNLTFVLPWFSNNLGQFETFERFHTGLALPAPYISHYSNKYQIFAHHARYNKDVMPKMMPKDTMYISIVREPATMYQSTWTYYSLQTRFGVTMEDFISDPWKYYYNESDDRSLQFARNPVMSDFGLEVEDYDNITAVQETINYIDQRFSLIMISDQMDESLVLLRNLLCWDWEDLVVFHLNRQNRTQSIPLSSKVIDDILDWNAADNMLYQHFLERFERKKSLYGLEKLANDVRKLQLLTAEWERKCLTFHGETGENGSSSIVEKCQFLCMDEIEFTHRIRLKLWPNYGFERSYPGRKAKYTDVNKNYCEGIIKE